MLMHTMRHLMAVVETTNPMNPYQTFNHLLSEASAAGDAVDRFDLHSEDPNSVKTWEQLLRAQRDAYEALIAHVLEHGSAILATITHT